MTTTINVTFEDEVFERLDDVKGERSWQKAIMDEFNVEMN